MPSENCDILVIGSGIAGLSFALYCSENFPDRKVVVLSKSGPEESNTHYAQGGIAAVMEHLQDSFGQHIEDTLVAGDGLCDPEVVKMVVKKAPGQMLQLMKWGVRFDRKDDRLELGREGGHSANRILHCKDHTGASVSETLLQRVGEKANITLRENEFVLELLTNGQKGCTGALIGNSKRIYQLNAHYTMLASGGAGQVYELTSNPPVATGDGMALASAAGAELANMAFVQFHPTVLFEPGPGQPFLVSEAVRGFGAILRNDTGEDFMYRYDPRGSLATRDIVSRAIFNEMRTTGKPHVWLDLRHLNTAVFADKFPTIAAHLQKLKLYPAKNMIPVLPAAHYFCGGIQTNLWGETSIAGLLACGECASTGLHGANRLASNSLLEALVFAYQASERLRFHFREVEFPPESEAYPLQVETNTDYTPLRKQLQSIMTRYVGIVRSGKGLTQARNSALELLALIPAQDCSIPAKELRNLALTALAVIDDSLRQKRNCGGFYREDLVDPPGTLNNVATTNLSNR